MAAEKAEAVPEMVDEEETEVLQAVEPEVTGAKSTEDEAVFKVKR